MLPHLFPPEHVKPSFLSHASSVALRQMVISPCVAPVASCPAGGSGFMGKISGRPNLNCSDIRGARSIAATAAFAQQTLPPPPLTKNETSGAHLPSLNTGVLSGGLNRFPQSSSSCSSLLGGAGLAEYYIIQIIGRVPFLVCDWVLKLLGNFMCFLIPRGAGY